MNDRELLEAAAKAAGIKYWVRERARIDSGHAIRAWNPLTDDGDALRLAVKLRLQITPGTYNKDEFSAFRATAGEAHEHWGTLQDEYAATRRAIVRAAATLSSPTGQDQPKAAPVAWKCTEACFYYGTGKTCAVCHPAGQEVDRG